MTTQCTKQCYIWVRTTLLLACYAKSPLDVTRPIIRFRINSKRVMITRSQAREHFECQFGLYVNGMRLNRFCLANRNVHLLMVSLTNVTEIPRQSAMEFDTVRGQCKNTQKTLKILERLNSSWFRTVVIKKKTRVTWLNKLTSSVLQLGLDTLFISQSVKFSSPKVHILTPKNLKVRAVFTVFFTRLLFQCPKGHMKSRIDLCEQCTPKHISVVTRLQMVCIFLYRYTYKSKFIFYFLQAEETKCIDAAVKVLILLNLYVHHIQGTPANSSKSRCRLLVYHNSKNAGRDVHAGMRSAQG